MPGETRPAAAPDVCAPVYAGANLRKSPGGFRRHRATIPLGGRRSPRSRHPLGQGPAGRRSRPGSLCSCRIPVSAPCGRDRRRAGVVDRIGFDGEEVDDARGSGYTKSSDACQVACILAVFRVRCDEDPDEIKCRVIGEMADGDLTDRAGRPLNHSIRPVAHPRLPFCVGIRTRLPPTANGPNEWMPAMVHRRSTTSRSQTPAEPRHSRQAGLSSAPSTRSAACALPP